MATDNELLAYRLNNPSSSNFTIKLDGYIWRLHSNVISRRSTFFDKLCNGHFKESKEKTAILHDDNPMAMAYLIVWLYAGILDADSYRVDDMGPGPTEFMDHSLSPAQQEQARTYGKKLSWEKDVSLLIMAWKYGVDDLCAILTRSLKKQVCRDPELIREMFLLLRGQTAPFHRERLVKDLVAAWWQYAGEVAWKKELAVRRRRYSEMNDEVVIGIRRYLTALISSIWRDDGQNQ